jgi:hypothetical protein
MYTAAVTMRAAHARHARVLIDLLIGVGQCELRERAGLISARR